MPAASPTHDTAELTRFIETRYHARHRQQFPLLVRLAEMIEDLHDGDADIPQGLFDTLQRMIDHLEEDMKKEELKVFPAIRRGDGMKVADRIAHMRANHENYRHAVAEIRRLTGDLNVPKGACEPWVTLYGGLSEFIADLQEHLRLENEVLYPSFEGTTRG
ncbi:hypothetical protein EF888_16860 [Silicimonas algicola]|uniref:Regulator of cell morphogenesis and NO signaling n=1 Tax=Silicimonas algicola TaxID=1826607 RepID=A0A316G6N4_9RHOB|nr:hemerythrin domain-containing protein [Silicimonas algicola]AZQ68653.1 hypothetical protein EF888_16860 [Silicimonas algicola]PWK55616.1 regulator of cell morphogenesis and NO signaling [Silicimonas algicola]